METISFDLKALLGASDFHFKAEITNPITAIMGSSGSGKTTLAILLAGLLKPLGDYFWIGDFCLYDKAKGIDIPSDKRGIGYVFQNYRLFPHLTVKENIFFPSRWGGRAVPSNIEQVISVLGLKSLLERKPSEISGGQAQRTALARAIASAERLLILDEPLSNLDKKLRKESLSYLAELPSLLNVPLFYITHQLEEALSIAKNGLYIEDGRIVRQGLCIDIY